MTRDWRAEADILKRRLKKMDDIMRDIKIHNWAIEHALNRDTETEYLHCKHIAELIGKYEALKEEEK